MKRFFGTIVIISILLNITSMSQYMDMPLGHEEYAIYPLLANNMTSLEGTITEEEFDSLYHLIQKDKWGNLKDVLRDSYGLYEDFDILGKGHEYVNKYRKGQSESMFRNNTYSLASAKKYLFKEEKVAVLQICYNKADFTDGDIFLVFRINKGGGYEGNSVLLTEQFTDGRRNYRIDLLDLTVVSYNGTSWLQIKTYFEGSMQPDSTKISWFNLDTRAYDLVHYVKREEGGIMGDGISQIEMKEESIQYDPNKDRLVIKGRTVIKKEDILWGIRPKDSVEPYEIYYDYQKRRFYCDKRTREYFIADMGMARKIRSPNRLTKSNNKLEKAYLIPDSGEGIVTGNMYIFGYTRQYPDPTEIFNGLTDNLRDTGWMNLYKVATAGGYYIEAKGAIVKSPKEKTSIKRQIKGGCEILSIRFQDTKRLLTIILKRADDEKDPYGQDISTVLYLNSVVGTPDFEYYEYKGTKWLVVQGDMEDGSKRTEWYNLLTDTSDLCYVSTDDTEKKEKTDIEWTGDPTVKLPGKIQLLLYKGEREEATDLQLKYDMDNQRFYYFK